MAEINNGALSDALSIGEASNAYSQNATVNLMGIFPNVSYDLITLRPYLLSYAYKTYGFIQKAIKSPVEDAFRGGIKINTDTLSNEEIEELEKKMSDEKDIQEIKKALIWGGLFGGSVLIANTEQKPSNPLSEKALYKKKLKFISADRWEAICENAALSPEKSNFVYRGVNFDNSRVIPFLGDDAPYYVRMRLQGWGLSKIEKSLPPLLKYLKSQNVIMELLDEKKIDVLKIKGLAQTLMTPEGVAVIKKRVDIAASNKNFKSMLTMDSEDDYQQKELSMSGLAEFNKEIRLGICACLNMPEVKIWGTGEGGFSNGEDKLELYNSMVESEVREKSLDMVKRVVQLRCLQLFGRQLPDLRIDWENLRLMPESEEQAIRNQKYDNALKLYDRQLLTKKEFVELLKKEKILDVDVKAENEDEYSEEGANEKAIAD